MSKSIDTSNEVFIEINKNMKYGAPELKKLYQKYVTRGLIIAIILHVVLISGYVLAMYLERVKAENDRDHAKQRNEYCGFRCSSSD